MKIAKGSNNKLWLKVSRTGRVNDGIFCSQRGLPKEYAFYNNLNNSNFEPIKVQILNSIIIMEFTLET